MITPLPLLDIVAYIVFGIITVLAAYAIIRHHMNRYRDQKGDLARYWLSFSDAQGCQKARAYYEDGMQIIDSTTITFAEIGCPSEDAFRTAAIESLKRRLLWLKKEQALVKPWLPTTTIADSDARFDTEYRDLEAQLKFFDPHFRKEMLWENSPESASS